MAKVFNVIFTNISNLSWQFYWWRKLEYPEKTTDLPLVIDNNQLLHDAR